MKIESVSCRQFAGLRNLKPVQFKDGLNIIYGPNESGKSTLVGLIYNLLWKNCNVGNQKKDDKEYRTMYFPAVVKNGASGSTIDGRLVINGDDGKYTITKKWAANGSGELETPKAILDENSDSMVHSETMKSLLKYGEGVYREAIFANQKTIDSVLQALLDGKLKTDLSSVASSAMMDMGGISSEKFLAEIDKKLKALEDSWDWKTDGPKNGRGIDNRIKQNVGDILKAYYALEDSRKRLDDLQKKVNAVDNADREYAKALEDYEISERAYNEFSKYHGLLVNYKKTKDLWKAEKIEKDRRKDADEKWPVLINDLNKARSLGQELARAEVSLLWKQIREIQKHDADAEKEISGLHPVDEADVIAANELEEEIRRIENRLKAFSALISFSMQQGYELIVTSDVDGRRIELNGSSFEAIEAVQIEIPGVAIFHLSAADLDVEAAKAELIEAKDHLKVILDKYKVKSAADLESERKRVENERKQKEKERHDYAEELKKAIGNKNIDAIKAEYEEASKVSTRFIDEIQKDIKQITSKPIGTYISLCEQKIENYKNEYESLRANKEKIKELDVKISKHSEELAAADQIPKKYLSISDPDGRKEELEGSVIKKRNKRDTAHGNLLEARAIIKAAEEADDYLSIDELKETVADNEALFIQNKHDFKAWKQIKEAAESILNSVDTNPLQQFEDDFRKYLTVLSADGVTLSSLGEKMKADIYSGDNRMTFNLLSEGTKDTIALAFRLAVIKFLFPNGGGFAVFDDPFTDMDAERRTRACKLLKEFAVDNQIIFATCDRNYFDTMGGNLIDFTNVQ